MALRFQPVDSDESSEDYSEENEERRNVEDRRQWFGDSSEEEDETRVVRSQKDKKWEILTQHCAKIKNKLKIQDYTSIFAEFEELNKQIIKSDSVIQIEGVPVFYTRTLVRLEEAIANLTKEAQKKLSSTNAKSFIKLKAKLKKHNKIYEDEINKFRANPVESEESSEYEEEEPEAKPAKKSTKKITKKPEKDSDEDQESDDDDDENKEEDEDDDSDNEWGEGSEEDESDDIEARDTDPQNRRAFWTIKEGAKDDTEDKKEKKRPERKIKKEVKEVKEEEKQELFTFEVISSKLKEIVELRTKRILNTETQIQDLRILLTHCKDVELSLQILNLLILFQIENSKDAITVVMPRFIWLSIYNNISKILELYAPKAPLSEDLDSTKKAIIASTAMRIDRLSNELTKAFKTSDPKSAEYNLRLADNIALSKLIHRAYIFYENINDNQNLVKLAVLKIYQIHYIHDDLLAAMRSQTPKLSKDVFYYEENTEQLIESLVELINKEGEPREVVFANLMAGFHHALHGRYEKASELLEKANSNSAQNDIIIQVYSNRLLIQIGLSEFYNGKTESSFKTLNEIVSTHRLKDILAQSLTISKEKITSQERDERRRSIPYHMHINTDVIETVYFICAMLIDIPKMALNPQDPDKFTISKYFKKLMEFHERQASSGLTEGFREFIIAAADKLRKGYWREAYDVLDNLEAWNYVPRKVQVKSLLLENLKECGMITYVLTYGKFYENFSKKQLSEKFNMDVTRVEKSLQPLISSGEVNASWNGEYLVLDLVSVSRIQFLSERIKEKGQVGTELGEKFSEFYNFLSSNIEDYPKSHTSVKKKKVIKKLS